MRAQCVEVGGLKQLHVGTFKKNKKIVFKRNNNHCKGAYALILLKAAYSECAESFRFITFGGIVTFP